MRTYSVFYFFRICFSINSAGRCFNRGIECCRSHLAQFIKLWGRKARSLRLMYTAGGGAAAWSRASNIRQWIYPLVVGEVIYSNASAARLGCRPAARAVLQSACSAFSVCCAKGHRVCTHRFAVKCWIYMIWSTLHPYIAASPVHFCTTGEQLTFL